MSTLKKILKTLAIPAAVAVVLEGICLANGQTIISGAVYCALRLPPIIVSLGVTLVYEGIMYTMTGGKYLMSEVQNRSMS
nr:hypothetical protein [Butyrivibrio sp.]